MDDHSNIYRVLLVEDEPGDALLIRKMLKSALTGDFKIEWVTTMAEAKKCLQRDRFHLVLLDLSLPDSFGLDTVRVGHHAAGSVPVVVLTGYDDLELALASLDEGAQDYLVKGDFDNESLVRAIRYALARAQSERDLKKSEERFRSVIHSMDDVLWIASLSRGEMNFLSPTIESLMGCTPEELMENPNLWTEMIHPEDSEEREIVKNRFKERKDRELTYRIIRSDGDVHWVRDRFRTIVSREGKPLRMYGLLTDVTKQVLAEKALEVSRERYRILVESATQGIMVLQDSILQYVNPMCIEVFGYPQEYFYTRPFEEFLHPGDREMVQKRIHDLLQGEKDSMMITARILSKEEGYKWVEYKPVLIEWAGSPAILGLLTDITEKVEAQEKIHRYTNELELKSEEMERLYHQLDETIDKARQIHESTIPDSLPEIEGLSLSAYYRPAQKMGGDYYNVIRKGSKLVLYLSDVTGHGLEGALLSLFVKHTIDSYISLSSEENIAPQRMVRFLAKEYEKQNYPDRYFICIFLGVLDLDTMEFTYIGAGFQNYPLIKERKSPLDYLKSPGIFIGSLIPLEKHSLEEHSTLLTPGTTIFFSTDGLIEQEVKGERFEGHAERIFVDTAHLPPEYCMCCIKEGFLSFNHGSMEGEDDLTLLILQSIPEDQEKSYFEIESSLKMVPPLFETLSQQLLPFKEREIFLGSLGELVKNAIIHGNGLYQEKRVKVVLFVGDTYVLATVEDEGEGFDWRERLYSSFHGEREEGGLVEVLKNSQGFCYNQEGNKAFFYQVKG